MCAEKRRLSIVVGWTWLSVVWIRGGRFLFENSAERQGQWSDEGVIMAGGVQVSKEETRMSGEVRGWRELKHRYRLEDQHQCCLISAGDRASFQEMRQMIRNEYVQEVNSGYKIQSQGLS